MNPEDVNQQEGTLDPNQHHVTPQVNAPSSEGEVNNEALMEAMQQLNNLSSNNPVIPQYNGAETYQYSNVSTLGNVKDESGLKRKRMDLNVSTDAADEEELADSAAQYNEEEEEKPQQKKKRGSTSATTTPKAKKKAPAPKKAVPVAPATPKFNKKKVTANFKLAGNISHPDVIHSMQFNQSHLDYLDALLVVGGNFVSVHKKVETSKGVPVGLKLMKTFEDDTDQLTTGSWGVDANGDPIIAVAGKSGVVKVWNFSWKAIKRDRFRMMRLPGHGGAINEVCFHPTKRELLVTCSQDHSIRLWDLTLGRTVAIFSEQSPVLSVDFHMSGTHIVSGSQDGMRIWSVDNPADARAMEYVTYLRNKQRSEYRSRRKNSGKSKSTKEESTTPTSRKTKRPNTNMNKTDFYYFYSSDEESQSSQLSQQQQQQAIPQMIVTPDGRITYQQAPIPPMEDENLHVVAPTLVEPTFFTNKVHSGAVDSVKYFGDLILSRASNEENGRVVLWAPNSIIYSNENTHGLDREQAAHDDDFTTIHVFTLNKGDDASSASTANASQLKMALDPYATQIAVPLSNGHIELFDLQKVEDEKMQDAQTPKKRPRNSTGASQAVAKRVSDAAHTLFSHDIVGAVRNVSFSYDQKCLVFGGEDKNIYKYDR